MPIDLLAVDAASAQRPRPSDPSARERSHDRIRSRSDLHRSPRTDLREHGIDRWELWYSFSHPVVRLQRRSRGSALPHDCVVLGDDSVVGATAVTTRSFLKGRVTVVGAPARPNPFREHPQW